MKRSGTLLAVFLLASAATAQDGDVLPPAETAHFTFEFPSGYPSSDVRELIAQSEQLFEDVAARLGVSVQKNILVRISPPNPGPCRSRGLTMALPEDPALPAAFIEIFASEDAGIEQLRGVFAHELGHVLQNTAIDGGQSIGSMFIEGFATWAAGPYWLRWQGASSFQSAVRSYLAAGIYLPLHENNGFLDTLSNDAVSTFGQDCLNRRDVIYTEWAAFIEYLVEGYGIERLYSLFQTPPLVSDDDDGSSRLPNFPAVYGSSLDQLEAAWLEDVTR